MKKIFLLVLLTFLYSQNALSQEEIRSFFNNVMKNENVKELIENKECLAYSNSRYLYLIINSKETSIFNEYFFKITDEKELQLLTTNVIENEELKKIFKKELYKQGLIDLNSSFYKGKDINQAGLPSFLSLISPNYSKYFEYFLPAAINIFPYDNNIRFLIMQRFTKYIGLNYIPDYSN